MRAGGQRSHFKDVRRACVLGRNLEDAAASGQSCPCTEGHPGVVRPRPYRAHASVGPPHMEGIPLRWKADDDPT